MAENLAPPPIQTPMIESPKDGLITKVWASWLRSLVDRAEVAAYAVTALSLTGQVASIGLTALVPSSANGLYRVSYRFRVSTAASVSSELQFSVTTTEGGVTVTQSSANYTGNATNAPQSGSFIVKPDAAAPLQYQVDYLSGGTAMAYEVDVLLERL